MSEMRDFDDVEIIGMLRAYVNKRIRESSGSGGLYDDTEIRAEIAKSLSMIVNDTVSAQGQNTTIFDASADSNGDFLLTFNKINGYIHMSPYLGKYADIGNDTFSIIVKNTGENYLRYGEIFISRNIDWGTNPPKINDGYLMLAPGESTVLTIRPSDYANNYSFTDVYMVFRDQDNDNNADISLKFNILKNAQGVSHVPNASEAKMAKNAGGYYLDEYISADPAIIGTEGQSSGVAPTWTEENYFDTVSFDGNIVASGNYYASISWDIKELFGKGIKLRFEITNESGTNSQWKWNNWHLSRLSRYWGNYSMLSFNPISYGADVTANKSEFEIDIDTDWQQIDYTQESAIYLLIGAAINNPSNIAANTLGIRVTAIIPGGAVVADKLKGFNPTDYYTKEQLEDLIPNSDTDLLFWGDSMTAGAGGGGVNYPLVCATELGKTFRNCGVGGENANTIAARQGGNALVVPAGPINGQYAYNELEDIFGATIKPLRQGDGVVSGANKIYIDGEECTLSITQSSSNSTDAIYTIAGYTGGTSVTPKLARFIGSTFTANVVVIYVGQNGSDVNGDTSVNARMTIIDSMIAHIPHKKYVVMGLTEADQASDHAALFSKYGNNFFPTKKLLIDYGLTINGLTPTSQDKADIAAGRVPTSLKSDNTHLNSYGYTAVGKMLADKIRSLGYFD